MLMFGRSRVLFGDRVIEQLRAEEPLQRALQVARPPPESKIDCLPSRNFKLKTRSSFSSPAFVI